MKKRGEKIRTLRSRHGVAGQALVCGGSLHPPQCPSTGQVVATDLICICMNSRRWSRWHLLLDRSHRPVRHQDELGGQRHIPAQGPVYLQQVSQLWLARRGGRGRAKEREQEKKKDRRNGREGPQDKINRRYETAKPCPFPHQPRRPLFSICNESSRRKPRMYITLQIDIKESNIKEVETMRILEQVFMCSKQTG